MNIWQSSHSSIKNESILIDPCFLSSVLLFFSMNDNSFASILGFGIVAFATAAVAYVSGSFVFNFVSMLFDSLELTIHDVNIPILNNI